MLPPRSEAELLARARTLAGRTLAEVAPRVQMTLPETLRRQKGFVGQMVERALGASAGSRSEPDFVELGIELKTLPIDERGKPKESTFVASLVLSSLEEIDFEDSLVAKKLSRVLWVPVEATGALTERRIGGAILWQPSPEERAVLREDYERIADLVVEGQHDAITGHLGAYLQVRPKAADGSQKREVIDGEGRIAWSGPRGFYLRPTFTARVLAGRIA
ncbi:MAG: DNA mismatch repair endonuclease MutH [Myxococcota bacterium]